MSVIFGMGSPTIRNTAKSRILLLSGLINKASSTWYDLLLNNLK